MVSKHEFKVDQQVKHDFSGEEGYIIAIRENAQGYDYCVEWFDGTKDWYKQEVLKKVGVEPR